MPGQCHSRWLQGAAMKRRVMAVAAALVVSIAAAGALILTRARATPRDATVEHYLTKCSIPSMGVSSPRGQYTATASSFMVFSHRLWAAQCFHPSPVLDAWYDLLDAAFAAGDEHGFERYQRLFWDATQAQVKRAASTRLPVRRRWLAVPPLVVPPRSTTSR